MFVKQFGQLSLISLALAALASCGESPEAAKTDSPKNGAGAPASASSEVARLELHNSSSFARLDEAVYLSYHELGLPADFEPALAVWKQSTALPVQAIDKDADGDKDGILFALDIAAEETLQLRITESDPEPAEAAHGENPKRTQAEISRKTGGRWVERKYEGGHFQNVSALDVPAEHTDHSYFIRYEGPGIESDLVGYRVYLDWRNGFDVFGKRTREPVLQDVGQDGFDSYHEMSDWGMDILKVGSALGVGGYGYWDGEKTIRVSDVQNWSATIAENGELYSSFALRYSGWRPSEGQQTDLNATLAMRAGSRLVEVEAQTSAELENMAAGLVKLPGTKLLVGDLDITGKAWTYIGTYGPQSLDGSKLGLGLLVQKQDIKQITEDEHNQVVVLNPRGQQVHYYFTAAWELEASSAHGPITDAEQFEVYLAQEAEKLTMPLRKKLSTRATEAELSQHLTAEVALEWSRRLADAELQRHVPHFAYGGFDPLRKRPSNFEYTTGLLVQAIDDLNSVSPDSRYARAVEQVMGSFVTEDGDINSYDMAKYNIDSINSGKMLLRLHERNQQENFKVAVDTLRTQLEQHPRTSEGAFWHKQRYPFQVWLDGVYMGMPFLAHYENLFHEQPDFDEVLAEFKLVRERLRDPHSGLYYHAWDEKRQQVWADKESGLSEFHWSRGMGWMAMALVDVLDFIPAENAEQRAYLVDMIAELAPVLERYQDADTGTWYQITDKPSAPGNYLEASGSSMFTYFFAKAINKGYLPESYVPLAKKSYRGLLNEFLQVHADGSVSLTNICEVAGLGYGRDGSYRYYMSEPVIANDPKGVGPFIMAGVQMSELLNKRI
ncbi:glycoside hydrolase family 88 protein [Microbulbifer magnicolonia]|uniref:glycoside hydrolase family 88 protein n=1 Tax=Microbulbifer magnicolonia TaxID=3109744 RepID=UPI002B41820C|nr:glycoside hydrolase family 88 protein [Microbulbifer sp. GG15]